MLLLLPKPNPHGRCVLVDSSSQAAYHSPRPQAAGIIHSAARPLAHAPASLGCARSLIRSVLGFGFVDKDVVDIQTACSEAWKKLAPILYGYVDFDENYPEAIAELEAAGINEYVAEVNRQLEEFMANNK